MRAIIRVYVLIFFVAQTHFHKMKHWMSIFNLKAHEKAHLSTIRERRTATCSVERSGSAISSLFMLIFPFSAASIRFPPPLSPHLSRRHGGVHGDPKRNHPFRRTKARHFRPQEEGAQSIDLPFVPPLQIWFWWLLSHCTVISLFLYACSWITFFSS